MTGCWGGTAWLRWAKEGGDGLGILQPALGHGLCRKHKEFIEHLTLPCFQLILWQLRPRAREFCLDFLLCVIPVGWKGSICWFGAREQFQRDKPQVKEHHSPCARSAMAPVPFSAETTAMESPAGKGSRPGQHTKFIAQFCASGDSSHTSLGISLHGMPDIELGSLCSGGMQVNTSRD